MKKNMINKNEELKFMNVWIDILHDDIGISFNNIAILAECTTNSITNWRKGEASPSTHHIIKLLQNVRIFLTKDNNQYPIDANIENLYKKLQPKMIINETLNKDIFKKLKSKTTQCNIIKQILNHLSNDDNTIHFIDYYSNNYQKALQVDTLSSLLQNKSIKNDIIKILFRKLQIKQKLYKFFEINNWNNITQISTEYKQLTDYGCCLLLKLSTLTSNYSILIGIQDTYTKEELKSITKIKRQSSSKPEVIDMVLLSAIEIISEKEFDFYVTDNIYMEVLNAEEILQQDFTSDFVCLNDLENKDLIILNQICESIWSKVEKYISVIYKNIIFKDIEDKTRESKRAAKGFLWESRFANRHEVNFECERIKEFMSLDIVNGQKKDIAVAIGFVSFPVVIMLKKYFKKVILLDNAVECINAYNKQYNSDECIEAHIFTSNIGNYVTTQIGLYHSVDLIVMGVGYTSFIKKPPVYFQYINTWLKTDGIVYLSYYNTDFIYDYIDTVTLESNMDFLPLPETKAAKVNINRLGKYYIYCKTADYKNIKIQLEKYFCINKIYSYPIASITFEPGKQNLQHILNELDKEYAKKSITSHNFSNCKGCFLDLICFKHKGQIIKPSTFENAEINCGYFISKSHLYNLLLEQEVYGMQKDGRNFVKVLIFENKNITDSVPDKENKKYYVLAIPADKQLEKITGPKATFFQHDVKLITTSHLSELGFEIGSITPFFSFDDKNISFEMWYDNTLIEQPGNILFMGSGRCDTVLRMSKKEFIKCLNNFNYKNMTM